MNPLDPGQQGLDRPFDIRVRMHRQHRHHVREPLHQRPQGGADLLHSLVEVLPPVRRHQHQPAAVQQRLDPRRRRDPSRLHLAEGPEQRIDAGVAGDPDGGFRMSLRQQRLPGGLRRGEMQVGDLGDQPAVHLLGEGGVLVPGPKPRLNVSDPDLAVVGGQRRGHGGGGVALHHHPVRTHLLQHRRKGLQGGRGQARQGLVRPHHVQVVVGADAEEAKHLVQDLPVLAGDADHRLQALGRLQRAHDGRHLDRFRPGAEHGQDLQHAGPAGRGWGRKR